MVEEERKRIRQAQTEGIRIARANSKYKGRPIKYSPNAKGAYKVIYDQIIERLDKNESVQDISRYTGVSRATIYKMKKKKQTI
ncbi:helix-turn-helix domain-containing protein [Lysinibacillus sp. FSL H8-0500]|uniref:helix-turn-helix domain-containing protein n=1 Tax=Lysinibacillus sp. FSL H8-0500 TaxID=2921393 RepID=UPI003101B098